MHVKWSLCLQKRKYCISEVIETRLYELCDVTLKAFKLLIRDSFQQVSDRLKIDRDLKYNLKNEKCKPMALSD